MNRPMFSSVVHGLHISDGDSSGRLDDNKKVTKKSEEKWIFFLLVEKKKMH